MLNSFQHLRESKETLNQVQGDAFGVSLEGKKAYLDGTWRAVVGRLEGKDESQ